MVTEFIIPAVRTVCPKDMTAQNCPLRKYLNNEQTSFHFSMNESYLIPNTDDAKKIADTMVKMQNICAQCKADNNQKMK